MVVSLCNVTRSFLLLPVATMLKSPTSLRPAPARWRGVTLLEMLAAMTILAVLLGVGAPSFSRLLGEYRTKGEKSGLQDALVTAREAARQSVAPVTLCASSAGTACTDTAFHAGYIVFLDANTNGVVNTGETVILRAAAAPSGVSIAAVETVSGGAVDEARFDAEGKLPAIVRFTVCKSALAPHQITARRNGHLVVARAAGVCP